MAAGMGETIFSEGVMAAGTGGTVFSEGMTSGGLGRSRCRGLRSPCRASPGKGGGAEGGGMLSPIGDGGFPARGAEQNTRSLSWGSLWKTHPPQTPLRGHSPVPPNTALRNEAGEGSGTPPQLCCPSPGGHPQRVPGAGCTMHRGTAGLHQALPPQSCPSSPGSCHLAFPWGDTGPGTPHGHRDPHTPLPRSPGGRGRRALP